MSKIKITFKDSGSLVVNYDDTLNKFLDTVPKESANKEDIQILTNYFRHSWPHKAVYLNQKIYNVADVFLSYQILDK